MFKVAAMLALAFAVVGATAYAGEIRPKPGEKFLPQVGMDKVKEINNPPRSDSQSGRVIESRDFQPKREPRPRDDD